MGFTANALEGTADMNIIPSSKIHDSSRPGLNGIDEAASLLVVSKRPLMIVGDRVSDDGAVDQAVELAELLGLSVYQSRGGEVAFRQPILNSWEIILSESLKIGNTATSGPGFGDRDGHI